MMLTKRLKKKNRERRQKGKAKFEGERSATQKKQNKHNKQQRRPKCRMATAIVVIFFSSRYITKKIKEIVDYVE